MFKWILGFLLLSSYASAELPYQVTDPATMHDLDYLDLQSNVAVKKTGSVMSGTLEVNNANIVLSSNSLTVGTPAICFADATCQTSAGTGVFAIVANAQQFTGNGLVASPLTLNSSSVTLQGFIKDITGNSATATFATNASHATTADTATSATDSTKLPNNQTVPNGLIDLSTVTTALSGKLSNASTVPTGLIDLSTVTTALNLKADSSALTSTASALTAEITNRINADLLLIPSTATGSYPLLAQNASNLLFNTGLLAPTTNYPTHVTTGPGYVWDNTENVKVYDDIYAIANPAN